jgi:hypothetical protein
MRYLIAMLISSMFLASCTPKDMDTAVQQNLPQICSATSQLHEAFLAITLTGEIKESTIRKEAAAWNGVQMVCADPGNATAIGTLARVSAAYAVIVSAMREAKGA